MAAQRAVDGVLPGGNLSRARRFIHGGGETAVERPARRERRRIRIEWASSGLAATIILEDVVNARFI